MSASATPSPLIAAMTSVIALAPASRTALTVGLLIVTPRVIRATSGTIVTLPLPDTVMVCWAGVVSVAGAPTTGPGRRARTATATMRAPMAPAPSVLSVLDMWITFESLPPGGGGRCAEDDSDDRPVPPQPRRVMQTVNATVLLTGDDVELVAAGRPRRTVGPFEIADAAIACR